MARGPVTIPTAVSLSTPSIAPEKTPTKTPTTKSYIEPISEPFKLTNKLMDAVLFLTVLVQAIAVLYSHDPKAKVWWRR